MASSKVVTTNPDQPRDSSSLSSSNSLSTLFLHLSDSDLHHSNTTTNTTMDDYLNYIYLPATSTAAASTAAPSSDDVWKEIVAGGSAVTHPNGEGITLEDFLTKAGAVREEDVRGGGGGGVPTTATAATTMAQFASSSVEAFGNNGVEAAAAVVGGKGKRRVLEETVDKATLQKQRRMIKNRESAARSRERKQAYTTELEHLVQQLEEENARLLSEEADKQQQRYKQLMECLIPIEERSEPKRRHQRTNSVEPATLVPLANQCKKVFLVGDPAQLPATVISDVAKNHGYGTSLFERLKQAGYPVKMLKTQYRMHPEIRSFPSREFYEDSLEDGDDIKSRTERAWHRYRCFGPFCFFDIHEGKEARPSGSGGSWINVVEVDFVLFLYQKLVTLYPTLKSGNQVAIISPYSQQVKLFQRRFEETFGVSAEKVVDICTVDGCQGREKDVAIFSCVRASKDGGIGFVEDIRRMNVGITRAKSAVLVVGSASTLRRSEQWNKLVESAGKRGYLFKVSQPYSSILQ